MLKYLKIGATGGIVALLLTGTTVFADAQSTTTTQTEIQQPSHSFSTERQRFQQVRSTYRAQESSTTARNSERATQFRARARQFEQNHLSTSTRREVQSRIQTFEQKNREYITNMRERVQRHLHAIENKVKQRLVERLTKRFSYLNEVWTNHFSKLLDRYAVILQKIQDRSDSAAASGKKVTTINTAIQSAQVAIQDAHSAITIQRNKIYALNLSSVSATNTSSATSTPAGQERIMQGFRTAFKTLRNQLFSNLSTLRSVSMTKVRTSVLAALHSLEKGQQGSDATSTTPTH